MKDITFRSPPGWYLAAVQDKEQARKLRVIDLAAACTDGQETAKFVAEVERRIGASYQGLYLGYTVRSTMLFRLFAEGDYVLVCAYPGRQGAFKTGFVEKTRSTEAEFEADVTFLDGTKGTYPYSRMIWAQVPGPLKALMDRRVCVENCPLKKEGACMRKGDE